MTKQSELLDCSDAALEQSRQSLEKRDPDELMGIFDRILRECPGWSPDKISHAEMLEMMRKQNVAIPPDMFDERHRDKTY